MAPRQGTGSRSFCPKPGGPRSQPQRRPGPCSRLGLGQLTHTALHWPQPLVQTDRRALPLVPSMGQRPEVPMPFPCCGPPHWPLGPILPPHQPFPVWYLVSLTKIFVEHVAAVTRAQLAEPRPLPSCRGPRSKTSEMAAWAHDRGSAGLPAALRGHAGPEQHVGKGTDRLELPTQSERWREAQGHLGNLSLCSEVSRVPSVTSSSTARQGR